MANIRKILIRIAAENHTTVAEVRREISIAIEEGMKSSDPKIQKNGVQCPEQVKPRLRKKQYFF